MEFHLRPPQEKDWPDILQAAHDSAPWAGHNNVVWLQFRQQFDEQKWRRQHYVVEEKQTRKIIAYGSIEEGPEPNIFRVFVVMSHKRLTSGLGQQLFDQLLSELKTLQAAKAWVREESHDPLLTFFAHQGFAETEQFTLPDGMNITVMWRQITAVP